MDIFLLILQMVYDLETTNKRIMLFEWLVFFYEKQQEEVCQM